MKKPAIILGLTTLLAISTAGADQVVYQSKWEKPSDPIGDEWKTNGQVEISPNGKRTFLGEISYAGALLTLEDLPPHEILRIEFDLIVRGPWDGQWSQRGGDYIRILLDEDRTLMDCGFANAIGIGIGEKGQSFPLSYKFGKYFREKQFATEVGTLRYETREDDGITLTPTDSTYHLDFLVPHREAVMKFMIKPRLYYDPYQDQSLGLDSMRITTLDAPVKFTKPQWATLSKDLEGEDVMKAYAAMWKMLSAPAQTRAFLNGAGVVVDRALLNKLVADLASEEFKVRQEAKSQLEKQPEAALPTLKAAVITQEDPEAVVRLKAIISKIESATQEINTPLSYFRNQMEGLLLPEAVR